MPLEIAALGSLVKIKTGAPLSRARKIDGGDMPISVKVLISSAISDGSVDDTQIAIETISNIKSDLYTQEGDVVVKTSTPYDCAYIDKSHEGMLVTSFGLILRPFAQQLIDMRYLAAYLGLTQTKAALQRMSKGQSIQLIKKKDIGELEIPIPSGKNQIRIADLFENMQKRKALCRSIIEKSDMLLQGELTRIALGITS